MSPDAAQEEVLEAADEEIAVAEGQRIAGDGPEDGDQAHHGEALHHGAEDVFAAHQAAVEESQAGAGHEQDEGRGGQHPCVVGGGLGVLDGLLEGGDLGLGGWGLCGDGRCGRLGQYKGWKEENCGSHELDTAHFRFRSEKLRPPARAGDEEGRVSAMRG